MLSRMMKLIQKFCVVCLSVLFSFALVGSGLQGFVLCHGENGHIAIEAAGSSCCTELLTGNSRGGSVASAKEEPHAGGHCGDCVDIPLSIGPATIAKDRCPASPTVPMSAVSVFAAFNSPNPSGYQLHPEPSAFPGYPPPLRSIILLI